jgi:hypothetical protein
VERSFTLAGWDLVVGSPDRFSVTAWEHFIGTSDNVKKKN